MNSDNQMSVMVEDDPGDCGWSVAPGDTFVLANVSVVVVIAVAEEEMLSEAEDKAT